MVTALVIWFVLSPFAGMFIGRLLRWGSDDMAQDS